MKLIIKKTDLLSIPYEIYDDLPEEFDIINEIKKRGNRYEDVRWFIRNCEIAQTKEMLEYYKSLNPHYRDVRFFITKCPFAQKLITLYPKGGGIYRISNVNGVILRDFIFFK
jgi:hypothetical protein